jgi:hypothetical protein
MALIGSRMWLYLSGNDWFAWEHFMSENIIMGCVTMAVCLTMQCVIVGILFEITINLERKQMIKTTLFGVSSLLVSIMLIMLAGNLLQITLWAGLFFGCGEFEDFATAFYHSVVNFTTLGYGDFVMSEGRRLLGALEAANGVLMFGLTTGLLFAVLIELMHREWNRRIGQDAESNGSFPH